MANSWKKILFERLLGKEIITSRYVGDAEFSKPADIIGVSMLPGVPRSRLNRMSTVPTLEESPRLDLNTRRSDIEAPTNPTEYTPQELRLFDEFGHRIGNDVVTPSHEANGAIIDDALNSGGIVFTRKDIPEVAEAIGLKEDGSQDGTTDVAKEDLAILTGEYRPPTEQKSPEDISPLQAGITPESPQRPDISEISPEFSLEDPVAEVAKPEIEVNSVTPLKNVEKVVLKNQVEDPLAVYDDASKELHTKLQHLKGGLSAKPDSISSEVKDENPLSAGKIPDFRDPRIQVDEPAVATELKVHTAEGVDAGIISNQADGENTSKIEESEPEVAPSIDIENNQIADDAITNAKTQEFEPNHVEIHPAIEATSEQVLSDSVVDKTADAEPQKTLEVLAQTTETSNNLQPQAEVAQPEPIQILGQGSENIVQAETADDGGEGEAQTRVIDQEAVLPEQVTKGELSQNTGNVENEEPNAPEPGTPENQVAAGSNVEDVEPGSGVLNDPNIFAKTNSNVDRTNTGFFASFADRFFHGNKKGRKISQMAREKDGDLNATILADKGHHVETEQEVLEKAA